MKGDKSAAPGVQLSAPCDSLPGVGAQWQRQWTAQREGTREMSTSKGGGVTVGVESEYGWWDRSNGQKHNSCERMKGKHLFDSVNWQKIQLW